MPGVPRRRGTRGRAGPGMALGSMTPSLRCPSRGSHVSTLTNKDVFMMSLSSGW